MKLNLLPTYVSKEKQGRGAWVVLAFLGILGVIIAVVMVTTSKAALEAAKTDQQAAEDKATAAKAESDKADAIMADKNTVALVRNVSLAKAMNAHNTVYPDLYDEVQKYIPSFFRVTSLSASPAGDGASTVNITGVLSSYQQYADLMLALLRIPGATGVSRSGYQLDDTYVPSLTPEDQLGKPIKPGDTNIPDDPLQRLQYFQAKGSETGYLGVSNFGQTGDLTKGPMPSASLVTVSVTIPKNLMTPDPKATLSSGASGAASGSAAGGAAGGFAPPGSVPPGASNGAPSGAPGGGTPPPPASAGGKRAAGSGSDD